jgi:hypothetical protein
MNGNGNYVVTGVRIRQTPQLNNAGQVSTFTIVTFGVGPHGPFTLAYASGTATAAQILQDITARVNAIRETDQAIAALNNAASHLTQ